MRSETLTGMFLLAAVAVSPLSAETPSLLRPYELHPIGGWAEAVAIGDVDGDGRNDVVMTTGELGDSRYANSLFVFSQGVDGRLRPAVSYPTSSASAGGSVATGDVNGDRRKDVVVDGAGVFLQGAGGRLMPMKSHPAQVGSLRVRVADFNGDRRDDVVSICGGGRADDVDLFIQQANGRLGPDLRFQLRHHGDDDMEVGDVDGDGRADLVVVSSLGNRRENIGVLPQNAAGGFGQAAYHDLGVEALYGGVGIGDVNGDGFIDLVVSSPGGGTDGPASAYVAALHGKPGGGFEPALFYDSAASPMAVEIDDLDLDGRDDVVVLHAGGPVGVYLQGADGRLASERTFALPFGNNENPHGLAIGDVDSDGLPDVVVANDNRGLVVLHHSGLLAPRPCAKDGSALCLMNGRFEIRVAWKDQHNGGREGVGHAALRTDLSGTFWFFSPESTELTVKAIDGRDLNDRFWIFYGSLSDVEYRVSALDTQTGELRGYPNPAGRICGRADTAAFTGPASDAATVSTAGASTTAGLRPDSFAAAAAGGNPPPPPPPDLPPPTPTPTGGTCTPGPETLCLLDGRLKVEARWKTRDGAEGRAAALPDTNSSGFFWFFSPENFELTVKALDGREVNDRFWFFYGALSDVEYWINVTDVRTGKFRTYHNAPGDFCGKGDVAAL